MCYGTQYSICDHVKECDNGRQVFIYLLGYGRISIRTKEALGPRLIKR